MRTIDVPFVALVPLLLLPPLVRQLPESINFLVREGRVEQARELLRRVLPEQRVEPDDRLAISAGQGNKASVAQLFHEGRTLNTLMLWLAFFCCLLMVYALSSWLPKLMNAAGYGLNSSLAFLLVLNFGALVLLPALACFLLRDLNKGRENAPAADRPAQEAVLKPEGAGFQRCSTAGVANTE